MAVRAARQELDLSAIQPLELLIFPRREHLESGTRRFYRPLLNQISEEYLCLVTRSYISPPVAHSVPISHVLANFDCSAQNPQIPKIEGVGHPFRDHDRSQRNEVFCRAG